MYFFFAAIKWPFSGLLDLTSYELMEKSKYLATLKSDVTAGMITGLMAIPLTVGICLMSEYPIKIGLYTVVLACIVGYISSLFRPGNYTGVPGIAAGLARALNQRNYEIYRLGGEEADSASLAKEGFSGTRIGMY